MKFTPLTGRISVEVSVDPGRVEAVLTVHDTGAGIAAEMMPRLFEPFAQADRTLDRSKGGLGLGLSVVKGLVEMHGGSVAATSQGVGTGATFAIRLPVEPSATAPREDRKRAPRGSSPRRVLVIEDNVDAANSMRDALELFGHTVFIAYDGPTGLEQARASHPEVVLCDIGLPGMDGYEVARTIRATPELSPITLVALSGYAATGDVAKAIDAGFDKHLAKPARIQTLDQVLAASTPHA
jgi:CheY-like chemotaxis protein